MPAKITRKGTAELWARGVSINLARGVLTRAGNTLAQHAKRKFRQSGKSVTGSIEGSIKVSNAFKDGDAWKVRVGPTHPAARFVIHGRRKGARMPPIETILDWLDARGITPTAKKGRKAGSNTGLAWAVAKAIARDGIPAFPFMSVAFQEIKQRLRGQIKEDIRKGLRKR